MFELTKIMKSKRIKLEKLRVKSFVTKIKESENITIKGGLDTFERCPTTTITVDTGGSVCIPVAETQDVYCQGE